jgi:three-Cys-motif partner protein
MAPRKPRLFDPGKPQAKADTGLPPLVLVDQVSDQLRIATDGARLVPGQEDGLPTRVVKPHSAEKATMVRRNLDIVTRALNRQWFDIHYLELFAGPGRLYDPRTDIEMPGSPMEALALPEPFQRYVLSDFSPDCVDALNQRIGPRPDVHVLEGDANDPEHLNRVCSLLDPKALVLAYLDPARPNLHFATVRYLAEHFDFLDLIINLPFNSIVRSMGGGGFEGPRLALDHPDPRQLYIASDPVAAIRHHYDGRLGELGFEHIARRTVHTSNNAPYYDIVLASRHHKGPELFEKANLVDEPPQLGFM